MSKNAMESSGHAQFAKAHHCAYNSKNNSKNISRVVVKNQRSEWKVGKIFPFS